MRYCHHVEVCLESLRNLTTSVIWQLRIMLPIECQITEVPLYPRLAVIYVRVYIHARMYVDANSNKTNYCWNTYSTVSCWEESKNTCLHVRTNVCTHDCTYFYHVFLNTGALVAAEDWEELVIWYEEEAREGVPLGVKVVVEALLAPLQSSAEHLKVLQSVGCMAGVQDLRVLDSVWHHLHKYSTNICT